jgi:hypothetical protein
MQVTQNDSSEDSLEGEEEDLDDETDKAKF